MLANSFGSFLFSYSLSPGGGHGVQLFPYLISSQVGGIELVNHGLAGSCIASKCQGVNLANDDAKHD